MGVRVFELFKDGEWRHEETAKGLAVPYPFETMDDLLQHGQANGLRIAAMMRANERVHEDEDGLNARLDRIWLGLRRCTAGAIPAVLRYYELACRPADAAPGVRDFLLSAAAFGIVARRKGLLAEAEVVVESEAAIVCAMAAAGLSAARGGSNEQVAAAAVIGFGMNDAVDGEQVQASGIEGSELLAARAIAAASTVLDGGRVHRQSFDQMIAGPRRSGVQREFASGTQAAQRVERQNRDGAARPNRAPCE